MSLINPFKALRPIQKLASKISTPNPKYFNNLKSYPKIGYLKILTKSNIQSWKSKEIKIFTEGSQSKEIINFNKKKKEVFNLISYSKLNEIISKILRLILTIYWQPIFEFEIFFYF